MAPLADARPPGKIAIAGLPVAIERMIRPFAAVSASLPGLAPFAARINAVRLTAASSPRLAFPGGMVVRMYFTNSPVVRTPHSARKLEPASCGASLPPMSVAWHVEHLD